MPLSVPQQHSFNNAVFEEEAEQEEEMAVAAG